MIAPRNFWHRASYAVPGVVAALGGVSLAAGWGMWQRHGGPSREPRFSDATMWGVTAGAFALVWLVSLRVRRSTGGMQALVAWITALTALGLFALTESDQSLAKELWSPSGGWGETGRLALIAAFGPVPAIYAIDYRRTDVWYVLPLLFAIGAWLLVAYSYASRWR
ncbi:hypothetical protein AYO38_08170 [bacterium SCGC AG-212-C10]|nr:hypothetical protein AYO38_08170 [bacterium SCGC AG-212-C10]